ncbi:MULTISPECIES: hypothetical protein [Streptacidiphilus]|uniref:Protein kinase domain-containing protein n=1 Tax=Streptacidiphilus cavernicola TaxID=3342716 RepID=A0ABV6ULW3_9ACTN|nr:hypothetical protein [Streptacidiphilus jeojiense]
MSPPDLSFTTPAGKRIDVPVRFGAEDRRDGQSPLRVRRALLGTSTQCVQFRLSVVDAAVPEAQQRLDAEVSAALRINRAFTDIGYTELFPDVLGYDLDCAEPFVLYRPPRGTPAASYRAASTNDQWAVLSGLMLALTLLEQQGLVHRGVTPATVRWDGRAVQLWGLNAVQRTGTPRIPWGTAPYASPEQRLGTGTADPRDAVWSSAQVLYRMVTGQDGPADRAPADLGLHRLLAETLAGAFAPQAGHRPGPGTLLDVLSPGSSARARLAAAGDELEPHRTAFDEALELKRRADPTLRGPAAEPRHTDPADQGKVLCPYCLERISYDPKALYTANATRQFTELDLSRVSSPVLREDRRRAAYQLCRGGAGIARHHVPVPYLTNGRPLTVAMVGQSATGKSHLLTQMIAEITDGGLEPYGMSWQSVNPQEHALFVRERVAPLRSGEVLQHTAGLGETGQVRFVEALLLKDATGHTRPLAFFDLAGEDLLRTDALLQFLLGVDALLFVVDPVLSLPLPVLDVLRGAASDLEVKRDGDPAFDTVLDRLPRQGPYLDVPAAIVLGKADLLRFEPPVDRWLGRAVEAPLSRAAVQAESRDVYALLHRHAGRAWLRPFDAVRQCTLHVASATGGREDRGRYPRGVQPQRVLAPLVSLLAMHGLVQAPAQSGDDRYDLGR